MRFTCGIANLPTTNYCFRVFPLVSRTSVPGKIGEGWESVPTQDGTNVDITNSSAISKQRTATTPTKLPSATTTSASKKRIEVVSDDEDSSDEEESDDDDMPPPLEDMSDSIKIHKKLTQK
jgi:hypothetical protein